MSQVIDMSLVQDDQVSTQDSDVNILILGFYDRHNTGDELYKVVLPHILRMQSRWGNDRWPEPKFTFKCMDDVQQPLSAPEYDIVIVGGGDVINPYFMRKAELLLRTYTGRVYALSVGIPYQADLFFLNLFDHVFVRSREEYARACVTLGSRNVTYMPDAAMVLSRPLPHVMSVVMRRCSGKDGRRVVGVCLAQPAFHGNERGDGLLQSIADGLLQAHRRQPFDVHLISFNQHHKSTCECDIEVHERLEKILVANGVLVAWARCDRNCAVSVYNWISSRVDVVVGMRYHSIVFAINLYKPVLALCYSTKVQRLASDFAPYVDAVVDMPVDAAGRPVTCDREAFTAGLQRCMDDRGRRPALPSFNFKDIGRIILNEKKSVDILVRDPQSSSPSFEDALFGCKKMVAQYMNLSSGACEDAFARRGAFLPLADAARREAVARVMCYSVTRTASSPYLWGLAVNMSKDDFCLLEAVKYIWEDAHGRQSSKSGEVYYSPPLRAPRRAFVNMDPYLQENFQGYHRNGWAYAVGALASIDAHTLMRRSGVMLDTYVDRSFHWGHDILSILNVLPYRDPWVGFLHHTFDDAHSVYNCVNLFRNEHFRSSLTTCKGIITLTEYLARQVRAALATLGAAIDVHVIYHPMETPVATFHMDKFLSNPYRCIVQIGAWLRDPYAIYALPIPSRNALQLHKCALKGKEMDQYFRAPDLLDRLGTLLLGPPGDLSSDKQDREDCPHLCRPSSLESTARSKYNAGLNEHIRANDASVKVLDRVSNDEYDELLSANIVFLRLVDCSAVNTVIECIVRNTPIVVNRHPALEEILGADYPGFYNDINEVPCSVLRDEHDVCAMHAHLKKLDKSRFAIETFTERTQDVVAAITIGP